MIKQEIYYCAIRAAFKIRRYFLISLKKLSKYLLHLRRMLRYNILKNNKVFRMNIINLPFDEPLFLSVKGEMVQLVAFKTQEHGNIKFGVQAPRSINVHREEIYYAIKQKQQSEQK